MDLKKALVILLVGCLLGAPTIVLAAKVTAVPAAVAKKYNIDTKWYKKYTTVKGIPIIASKKVDSRASSASGTGRWSCLSCRQRWCIG